jgi:hypothetical protein
MTEKYTFGYIYKLPDKIPFVKIILTFENPPLSMHPALSAKGLPDTRGVFA